MNVWVRVGAALTVLALGVGAVRADETRLRIAAESPGAVTIERQKAVEIRGRGRSWANVIPMRATPGAEGTPRSGFYLYLQDTKVEGSGGLFRTDVKTDAAGLYTASAYIDESEVSAIIAYLDATIARYRDIQGKDAGQVALIYNGMEDFTLEMAIDGKRQEFSIYSSGKLLRGQSFAVANRQMKVTLNGVEEFEKLRRVLREGFADSGR